MFALLMGFGACQSRQQSQNESIDENEALLPDETESDGNVQMQPSHVNDTVTWKGKLYTYDIKREADTLLPQVTEEETGKHFVDNHIDFKLFCEGKEICNKRFYKTSFKENIDESFLKNGVLEGLVFEDVKKEGIRFAVSVGYPRSDLYIPLVFTVDGHGVMSKPRRDEMLDAEISRPDDEGV